MQFYKETVQSTAIIRKESDTRAGTMPENERTVRFEPESESIVEAIVSSVAAIRNVEPGRLPPLGRTFDVEILERLFDPPVRGTVESGHVTFPYAGVRVTVDLDGELQFEWE